MFCSSDMFVVVNLHDLICIQENIIHVLSVYSVQATFKTVVIDRNLTDLS